MTYEEIRKFIADEQYCTSLKFHDHAQGICSTADNHMRQMEKRRDTRKQYEKRLKKAGYSDDQIQSMRGRGRRSQPGEYESIDLFDQPTRRRAKAE